MIAPSTTPVTLITRFSSMKYGATADFVAPSARRGQPAPSIGRGCLIIRSLVQNSALSVTRYLLKLGLATISASSAAWADFLELPADGLDVVGVETVAIADASDTLADIARRYNLGHEEIRIANRDVEFWLPGDGTRVAIPSRYVIPRADRRGFVLNIPEMRLYYFPEKGDADARAVMITHPVSIGRQDWATPLGSARITAKVKSPSWTPPDSIRKEHADRGDYLPRVVPPGPENPLGDYAMRLDIPGYLLHGTNRPYGVGMRVTHGCIRLYPEDIEMLFDSVRVGTAVQFVNQPIKAGWGEDGLYLEVHPVLEEDDRGQDELERLARDLLRETAGDLADYVSQESLARTVKEQTGRPVRLIQKLEG